MHMNAETFKRKVEKSSGLYCWKMGSTITVSAEIKAEGKELGRMR